MIKTQQRTFEIVA